MRIFIDFDGVLHDIDAGWMEYNDLGRALVVNRPGSNLVLFEWAQHLEAVLLDYPDVRLIVHSSWRNMFDHETIIKKYLPRGLAKRTITILPRTLRWDMMNFKSSRHAAIEAYVRKKRIEKWLVLDDDAREFPADYAPLIVCDSHRGVSDPAVLDALRERLTAWAA